jgi:hypothetical protein
MFGRRHRNYDSRTTAEEPFGSTTTRSTRRRGLFGNRNTGTTAGTRRGFFSRKVAPERRSAGLRSSLANPNTTVAGRQEAKAELREMGQSTHVPLSVKVSCEHLQYAKLVLTYSQKIRRTLGIRSTPRRRTARRDVL